MLESTLLFRIAVVACVSISVKWCDDSELFDMGRAILLVLHKRELQQFSNDYYLNLVMHLETKILLRFQIFKIMEGSDMKKEN